MKINDRTVKDGKDEHLTEEPEQIKAYRDTWEKGVHSYLKYLKERIVVARELLKQNGSIFVQISDDNVHLVRALLDEVFGSENFLNEIIFTKASGGLMAGNRMGTITDFILWYAKDSDNVKYRALYEPKNDPINEGYRKLELAGGTRRSMTKEEREKKVPLPEGSKPYATVLLTKPGPGRKFEIEYDGET